MRLADALDYTVVRLFESYLSLKPPRMIIIEQLFSHRFIRLSYDRFVPYFALRFNC